MWLLLTVFKNITFEVGKIPLIFFPSLLSSRACHRVQVFKSPGRVHDCTVCFWYQMYSCCGRGGGGEESRRPFPKGNTGILMDGIGLKLVPVKLTKGLTSKKGICQFPLYATKTLFPRWRVWNDIYSRENIPVIMWDNGTYHSIVGARESVPCCRCWARGRLADYVRACSIGYLPQTVMLCRPIDSREGRRCDHVPNLTVHTNHIITQ